MNDKTLNKVYAIEKNSTMDNRAVGIDGLRGIVALIIALFHFERYFPFGNYRVFATGYLGVEFFFVLSGFLLSLGYDNKIKTGQFLIKDTIRKRMIRLYPPYFVATFLLISLYSKLWFNDNIIMWLKSDGSHISGFLSELFCIQTTGISNFNYINYPAWYVSALLISIFIITIFLKIFKTFYVTYIAPIGAVMLYAILIYYNNCLDLNNTFILHIPIALVRALAGIMLGSFISFAYKKSREKVKNLNYLITSIFEVVLTLSFFSLLFFRTPSRLDFLVLLPISGIIIVMFSNCGLVTKIFSWRPIQYFGVISYSFYLLQSFCSNYIINVLNFIPQPYVTIVYLIINFIAALLLYYIIEIGLVKIIFRKFQWSTIIFGVLILLLAGITLLKDNNFNEENGNEIIITALDEQNPSAEGTEVWVIGAYIDDIWYDAVDIFDTGWIEDNGKVGWRSYDQLKNMQSKIKGKIPYGNKRQIVLDSNRWQGKAEIEISGSIILYDGFINSDSNNKKLEINSDNHKNNGLSIIWMLIIIIFALILYKYVIDIINRTKKILVDVKNYESRQIWADILRIFCIFNVVLLHGTVGAYNNFTNDIKNWYKFLYINSFTACAVPIFFMISGAFIIREDNNFFNTLIKRLKKITIPLFLWSFIYIGLRKYYIHEDIDFIKSIIKIPMEPQYSHLWFMYTLCSIYFLNPIISYIYYKADKKILNYIIIIMGVIPLILKTLEVSFGYNINIPAFFIGFPEVMLFILGKYIVDNQHKITQKWYMWAFISFLGYSIVVVLSYYYSIKLNSPYKGFFSNYGTIPIFIMYVSLFVMFTTLRNKFNFLNKKIIKIIYVFSDAGIGIYFAHMLVYNFLNNKNVFGLYTIDLNTTNVYTALITAIITFLISFIIYIAFKRLNDFIIKL